MNPNHIIPSENHQSDLLRELITKIGQLPVVYREMLAPEIQRMQDQLLEDDGRKTDDTVIQHLKYQSVLLDRAFTPICATDPQYRIIYWNKGMEDLIGWTAEEILGRNSSDVFQTVVPNSNRDEAIKILFEQGYYDGEVHYRHKDGHTITALVNSNVLKDERGEFLGLVSSFKDITAHNQAKEMLRKNEARQTYLLKLSDAIRPLSDAFAIQETVTQTAMNYFKADRSYYCEIDGDVVTIRRDAAAQLDLPSVAGVYSLSEMPIFKGVSQTGQPIVVPDVRTTDTVDEDLRQLCIQMQIIAYINVPVTKDGKLVGNLCLTQSSPRVWTTSEVALVAETAERTWAAVERARAEEALKASEEHYRDLFDRIDEGFCVIEVLFDEQETPVDYRFLEINPAFERQTGLENAVGRRMRDLAPLHEAHWFEIYGKIALTGEPMRFENRADQLHRYYEVYAFRVGKPEERKVAILFNDITERKRAEAAHRESEASLARSNQKISEILSSIKDHFYVLDRNWKFVYANKQFTGKIGKEPEDFIGNNIWELFPNHVGSVLYENFQASMEKGEIRRFDVGGQYTDAVYSIRLM